MLTVVSAEEYQIYNIFIFLADRLVSCCFIMPRMYIRKTSWKQD